MHGQKDEFEKMVACMQKNLPNMSEDTLPEGWELVIFRSDTMKGLMDHYSGLGSCWEVEVEEKIPVTIRVWNHNAQSDVEVNFEIHWLVFDSAGC